MKNSNVALCAYVIGCVAFSGLQAQGDSHTFVRPRALSNNSAVELSLTNYHLYHNNYDDKLYDKPAHRAQMSIQATDISQHMHSCRLSDYLLWDGKTELSVREDGSGDIGSVWLGLMTPQRNFASAIALDPSRDVIASVFTYHEDLSCVKEGLWFSMTLPVADVRHSVSLQEHVQGPKGIAVNSYGDTIDTVRTALNSRDMYYGKLPSGRHGKSGLDDTQLKVGYNLHECVDGHLGVYGNLIVPTSEKPTAKYLFEPVIGNGGHWGLGAGVNVDVELASNDKETISLQSDAQLRYLFCGTEKRSFDLKNGPWSRYLLVASTEAPNTPLDGINYFTRDLVVQPGASLDWFTALHYTHADFNLEVSWDAWWRDKERVKLKRGWQENIGIFDIAGDALGRARSASGATINSSDYGAVVAPSDRHFTPVTKNDLNLQSAAMPGVCTSTLSVGFSFNTILLEAPAMIGFVVSSECGCSNRIMSTGQVMFKIAASF